MATASRKRQRSSPTTRPTACRYVRGATASKRHRGRAGRCRVHPAARTARRPVQLFWTWTSPNLEFATVFVGVLAVAAFGLSFWQAVLAIIIGTGVGAITQGILSARGPSHGVPQMVLSRLGFGYWGNVLPGRAERDHGGHRLVRREQRQRHVRAEHAHALPKPLCLVIIVAAQVVIAFFGYNLVHAFERYAFPVLAVIFVIATIVILAKSHPGAPVPPGGRDPAGSCSPPARRSATRSGWNPYAADYTRYFPPDTSRKAIGSGQARAVPVMRHPGDRRRGVGDAQRGAALGDPTGAFTGHLPTVARRPHAAGYRARRGRRERAEHLLRRAVVRRHGHQAAAGAARGRSRRLASASSASSWR